MQITIGIGPRAKEYVRDNYNYHGPAIEHDCTPLQSYYKTLELVESVRKENKSVAIYTHSPYVLAAVNNCIMQSKVDKEVLGMKYAISADDVVCLYVDEHSIVSAWDEEFDLIDNSMLNSEADSLINSVFDELLKLECG